MPNKETPKQNAARLAKILADEKRWLTGDDRLIKTFTPSERKSAYWKGWHEAGGQGVMDLEVEM
jgi:hypothetical protein